MGYYNSKRRNRTIKIHKLAESIAWQIAKDRGLTVIPASVRAEAKQLATKQLMPRY